MFVMLDIQSSSPEEKRNYEIPKFWLKLCLHKKLALKLSTGPSALPIKVHYIVSALLNIENTYNNPVPNVVFMVNWGIILSRSSWISLQIWNIYYDSSFCQAQLQLAILAEIELR